MKRGAARPSAGGAEPASARSSGRRGPWGALAAVLALLTAFGSALSAEDLAPGAEVANPAAGADLAAASVALLQADALRDEGRWTEAAEAYWKARKANPADYRTHLRYQEMCLKAGDRQDDLLKDYDALLVEYPAFGAFRLHRWRLDPLAVRLSALDAHVKEHPEDADAALEWAAALLESGEPARAQKTLGALAGRVPASRADEALFLAAEADLKLGLPAEARKRVTAYVGLKPDHREALLFLARLDLAEARLPEALDGARKVLAARPLHLAATLVLAEALARGGQRDPAIEALEQPLRTLKDVVELLRPLADLVASQETEAGFNKAVELYDRVLALRAGDRQATYGKAWVLERQLKWKEAEDLYRKVLATDATFVRALHSVGFCAMRQGRASEAQVQFRKVLDMDAAFVPAMLDLGATFDLQADYASALKQYEKVLKFKGQENNLRALVVSAFDYEALGTFPKALDYLMRAHKVAPTDVDIVVWIGDNCYFQEKWKDAEKWYQKAIALDENTFFGWRGLGFTLGHQKRWTDAVAALERARAIKPTDKDVLLALGDIYLGELEDLEKALAAYEAYVAAGGDDPSVPELVAAIKEEIEASK